VLEAVYRAPVAQDSASLGLAGRVAAITGGGRGFGERIAVELAALGARVAVLDIDGVAAERVAAAVGGLGVTCDVSDPADVDRAFALVRRGLGDVEVLVKKAGVVSSTPFLELTSAEWDRILAVDLTSMMLCARQVAPAMVDRRSGRIVNVSSIAGKRGGGFLGRAAYAAAKAGVLGFTKALARELAPYGVTVNAVAPGAMDTEMTRVLEDDPELLARVVAAIPLGRRGSIQDAAEAVVFLCSDLASYVTGETVNVDGGVVME
jgi:3-oxoacyl-[acyl-carrier protein] reductase